MSTAAKNPHILNRGTRLSNAYTIGVRGLPCPKWAAEKTSAAYKAWKSGYAESQAAKS